MNPAVYSETRRMLTGLSSALRILITNRDIRERLGRNGPAKPKRISDPTVRLRELFTYLSESTRARKKTTANPVIFC
jgi:hypothetical protein